MEKVPCELLKRKEIRGWEEELKRREEIKLVKY